MATTTRGLSTYNRYVYLSFITCFFILQRWARAFRDEKFYAAVNTDNGIEALNRAFKYTFLPRQRKDTHLSSVVSILIDHFLPENYHKYLFLNYKQLGAYRSYKDFVPDFLHGRPKATILHCLDRKANSAKYILDDITIPHAGEGIFIVKGSGDKKYTVDFGVESSHGMPSCTCPDWIQWNLPCKHMFAIFKLVPEWNWQKLPSKYLNGPYLSTDNEAIAKYFQEEGIVMEEDPVPDTTEYADSITFDEIPKKSKVIHDV